MKKFEDKFFNILINRYGFYIKDYFSQSNNENKWVAISENDNYAYCVIVCDENNANVLYTEAYEQLSKMFTKPVAINVVIATKRDEISQEYLGQYNKLIYSLTEERAVYSGDGCKPLLKVCEYMGEKEKKHKNRFKDNKLTYILIGLNILIYILTAIMSRSLLDSNTYVLIRLGAKVNELINHGQVWRLLTCAFLHGGIMHLAFNMYALKIIGSEVEYVFGRKKYLIIYLMAALGGSIFSYIFSPYSISVGASGAIFGLLGAMLIFGIKHRDKIGKSYMMNIVQVIIINIIIGVSLSNIDNFAHLGGLIVGGVTALIVKSNLEKSFK